MAATGPDDGFRACYLHDDSESRREFDSLLARYLHGRHERWDITAIVEPLELLGRKAGQVDVRLRPGAAGELTVTLEFELAPAGAQGGDARRPAVSPDRDARGRMEMTGTARPADAV